MAFLFRVFRIHKPISYKYISLWPKGWTCTMAHQKLSATTLHRCFPRDVPICCSPLRRYRTMQIYLKTTPLSTNSPAKSRPNDGLFGDSLDVPLSSCSHIHTNRVAYPDLYLQLIYRIEWDLTWIKVSSCTFF